MKSSTSRSYDVVSRINHWVVAIAMTGVFGAGLYLEFGGMAREDKGVLLMPISGLSRTLFSDRSVDVFGLFTIPGLGELEWISSPARFIHTYAGYALGAVVLLHVAGALKHHFVERDSTLTRMVRSDKLGVRAE